MVLGIMSLSYHGGLVEEGAGFEPAVSSLRDWRP